MKASAPAGGRQSQIQGIEPLRAATSNRAAKFQRTRRMTRSNPISGLGVSLAEAAN